MIYSIADLFEQKILPSGIPKLGIEGSNTCGLL